MTNWEQYRRPDNTIDLEKAFSGEYPTATRPLNAKRETLAYIRIVEHFQLITSRQVAAVVIAEAARIYEQYER